MAEPAIFEIVKRLCVPLTFQPTNQVLYYDATGFEDLRWGEPVIAETRFGPQIGWVRCTPQRLAEVVVPYRLLRRPTTDDIRRYYQLREKARRDMEFVRQKVREQDLPMRLLEAEYPLDQNQLGGLLRSGRTGGFSRVGCRPKAPFPQTGNAVSDWRPRRSPHDWRSQAVWTPSFCSLFLRRFESVTMKMAKGTNVGLEPISPFGSVRETQMLPLLRARPLLRTPSFFAEGGAMGGNAQRVRTSDRPQCAHHEGHRHVGGWRLRHLACE